MKKLIIMIFIVGLSLFGLSACSPDSKEVDPEMLIISLSEKEQKVLGIERNYLSITLNDEEIDLDELKEKDLISKSNEEDAKVLIGIGKKVVRGIKEFSHEDLNMDRIYGIIVGYDYWDTPGGGSIKVFFIQLPDGEVIIVPDVQWEDDPPINDDLEDIIPDDDGN